MDARPTRPEATVIRFAYGRCALGVVAALAFYVGLVVWLTWPLAPRLATYRATPTFPAIFDPLYMGWALSWESHALTTAGVRLADANIYYPARNALFYGDTGFGALPLFLPIYLLSGNPTLALNVLTFGGITLTAWVLHLVVLRSVGSHLAGVVAAWTFLMTPWVLWTFIPSAPSYAVLMYFPLIIYLAATPTARFSQGLVLLALVVLQALTDVVYVALAVMAPLAALGVVRLAQRATRGAGVRLLAVVLFGALALLPVYIAHLSIVRDNPRLAHQSMFMLAVPPLSVPAGLLNVDRPTDVPLATLILILAGLVGITVDPSQRSRREVRRAWAGPAGFAIVGSFLSLSPTIVLFGHRLWLPQAYLGRWAPFFRFVRVPSRLGIAPLFGLSILAGAAFADCDRRLSDVRPRSVARLARVGLAVVFVGAAYTQYRGVSGPPEGGRNASVRREYPLVPAIASNSWMIQVLRETNGPLLEVPAGRPFKDARAMYRSIFHWHPLLNGYSSYEPAGFAERMALTSRLPDPEPLAALRKETGLKLILVNSLELSADDRGRWEAVGLAFRHDLVRIASDGPDWLFLAK